MAKFAPLFFFLCFGWICSLETSTGHSQDGSDLLLKVITALFDDNEITDIRDIGRHINNKQASSDVTGVYTGNKHTPGNDVRNVDIHYAGDTRHVENDAIQKARDTNDVDEEVKLLKEIETFLSSKRQKQKKWLWDDANIRATKTTSKLPTTTSTTTPTPTTTSTTTPTPTTTSTTTPTPTTTSTTTPTPTTTSTTTPTPTTTTTTTPSRTCRVKIGFWWNMSRYITVPC